MKLTKYASLSRHFPSFIYKILAQNYIDYNFPRHLFIETTAACNLKCSYCPREKRNDHMEFDLFKSIVDECTQHGPRSFSLHLFGEPLLYPNIIEAIRYIKSRNQKHTVLLTTNGTLLNKFADRLVEVGVDKIIWTWRHNNFTSHTIELLRKHGLIRLLIEETPKEEFEKWSCFPQVEIKHLHNYGGNIDTTKWGLADATNDIKRYPCYHLWLAPAIRWNGDITICCDDPTGVESSGKYGEISIGDFWKGERLKSIRESHIKREYSGICKGCDVWKTYNNMWFKWQQPSQS